MIKSLYREYAEKWSGTGSVYIISDTHFDDSDCKLMDPNWITSQEHINIIKQDVRKPDTLIHLGDVGNVSYLDELKCYKVLITGNHDKLSEVASHFDEVYTGPLFIADRLILSHEPIEGLENFAWNIHGHDHSPQSFRRHHTNLASNVYHFRVFNLGASIKGGLLSGIENYHRQTIDEATKKKKKEQEWNDCFSGKYNNSLMESMYTECKMNNRFVTFKTDCKDCQYNEICEDKLL